MENNILWVWKYDFYGDTYDVVYESGRIFTHTPKTLPKSVQAFMTSAIEKEVTLIKGVRNRKGETITESKTLYYTEASKKKMGFWILKKIEEV